MLILLAAASLCGSALAADLAEANVAFAMKDYPKALTLYTELAKGNNPEAQSRLGEMYWYGEGAPLDRSKADALFAKAAAAGNADAAANLQLSPQRAERAAQIAWWTTGYQGADLTSGQYACPAPEVPGGSRPSRDEIVKAGQDFQAWRICYEGFIVHLAESVPPGKRIPPAVALVMSEAELNQAQTHISQVVDRVLQTKKADSKLTLAALDMWRDKASKFVVDRNNRSVETVDWLDFHEREKIRHGAITGSARVSIPVPVKK